MLVVDDDPIVRLLMERVLSAEGYQVTTVEDAAGCLETLQAGFQGVVVLDVQLPDMDGTELFSDVRTLAPESPVIFLTGHGSLDMALDSIAEGAFEFLDKAGPPDVLVRTVRGAFELVEAEDGAEIEDAGLLGFKGLVTRSRSMRALVRSMRGAIDSKVPILVRGESGTGKELIARAIHERGPRAGGPCVAFNCAAVPENLVEVELFGSATDGRTGRLDQADRGTLLVEEVADLAPAVQTKLLRFLEDGSFYRVGGGEPARVDARIISTSSRNLEQEVEEGRLREDLYYRLAVFTINMPSLRERTEDIPALVDEFARLYAEREGRTITGVDPMAVEVLQSYSYPGNVRELENIVSYAVISSRTPVLTIADLPPNFLQAVSLERRRGRRRRSAMAGGGPGPGANPLSFDWSQVDEEDFPSIAELEARHIAAALELANGNKAKAARLLGISRMTLYRKINELDL